MPASNHTERFNLPLYTRGDNFSILGDLNDAMRKVEEEMGASLDASTSAARDSATALNSAKLASEKAVKAESTVAAATAAATNADVSAQLAVTAGKEAKKSAEEAQRIATNALSTANDASSTAALAKQTAKNSETAAESARNITTTFDQRLTTAESNSSTALAEASAAKNAVVIPRMYTSTYNSGRLTNWRSLADWKNVSLEANQKVLVIFNLRIAASGGIIDSHVKVSGPDGQERNIATCYSQDGALTVTGSEVFEAWSAGNYSFFLGCGAASEAAWVNPANGPHRICIVG